MANTRFTIRTLQSAVEEIVGQYPVEEDAIAAISELATFKGLKFNVVRRAYRAVQRIRTRRNTIE
jgi:hypothetical protein